MLRKQDWNFISCERLVLCNFQFVVKLFWYDQRNIEFFLSCFEGVNVVGWDKLHWIGDALKKIRKWCCMYHHVWFERVVWFQHIWNMTRNQINI